MQPNTLRSQARRHFSSSISRSVPRGMPPALLTRMSTSRQAAATCLTCALSVRSAGWVATATLWRARISCATLSSSDAVRAARCRWQPSAASDFAIASPMPFDPPVISAAAAAQIQDPMLAPVAPLLLPGQLDVVDHLDPHRELAGDAVAEFLRCAGAHLAADLLELARISGTASALRTSALRRSRSRPARPPARRGRTRCGRRSP